jgi:hypothetical protein
MGQYKPGHKDEEQKFDYFFIVFFVIGFAISTINMYVIKIFAENVLSFLLIIFIFIIPGVVIGLKKRIWGYGYMFGFMIAGIPGIFWFDLFIGGYTVVVSFFLFIILWLVFWKTWRSISGIKVDE